MDEIRIGDETNFQIEVANDRFAKDDNRMELDLDPNEDIEEALGARSFEESEIVIRAPPSSKVGSRSDGECSSGDENDMDVEGEPAGSNSRHFSKRFSEDNGSLLTALEGPRQPQPRQYRNPYLSDEGKKRASRAIRFHDSPFKLSNDTTATELPTISEESLLKFYKSCGLITDDWGELTIDKVGTQFRLDSILIRGINNMSTDEIFGYLYEMGLVPQAMEWVNDACCIAVYKDKFEAAGSLLKSTKPIAVNQDALEKKKSLLIEDKPIQDESDNKTEADKSLNEGVDYDAVDVIPHEKIVVPMPLGYVWRYARPCEKAKGVLMRFATNQDKKQERAEKFSEYYKRHGNPNNPNFRPSGDNRPASHFKSRSSLKRSHQAYFPVEEIEAASPSAESANEDDIDGENDGKPKKFNAWGKLSEEWGKEERKKSNENNGRANTPMPSRLDSPNYRKSHGNDDLRRRGYVNFKVVAETGFSTSNLRNRGSPFKRSRNDDNFDYSGRSSFADSGRLGHKAADEDDAEDAKWTIRLKGPTMRMHADEEETRMKLQARKKAQFTPTKGIAARLGLPPNNPTVFASVDFDDDLDDGMPVAKRSVKERLGVRIYKGNSNDQEEYDDGDYDNVYGEEEDLEALLQDD